MSYVIDRRLNGKNKSTVNRQRFLRRYREHIKKAVLEDEANRKALAARLHYALSFEQDPWKERIETPQLKKEFDTIKVVQIEEATV